MIPQGRGQCMARPVQVAGRGAVGSGRARQGMDFSHHPPGRGMAWRGKVRRCGVWSGWSGRRGVARQGEAWIRHHPLGPARLVARVRFGAARPGTAGTV